MVKYVWNVSDGCLMSLKKNTLATNISILVQADPQLDDWKSSIGDMKKCPSAFKTKRWMFFDCISITKTDFEIDTTLV